MIQSLRQAHAVLKDQEAYLRAILDNAAVAIFTLNAHGIIQSVNVAGEKMLGCPATEGIGQPLAMLIPAVAAGPLQAADGRMRTGVMECDDPIRDGIVRSLEIAISEMVVDGQRQFIAFVSDISARRHAAALIRRQAYYDSLTGLPNSVFLREHLVHMTAASGAAPFALAVLELDRLTDINNTLGRPVGDLALQQVGPRLDGVLGDGDMITFLGGGLFALLLAHCTRMAAKPRGYAVLKALESPFSIERTTLDGGARIGMALYPDHGDDPHLLLQRAEVALEVARQGGHRCVAYAAEQDPYSPRRLQIMGDLHQALGRDELLLHYQPKANLATGCIVGAEALVRWQHPEFGMIPPAEFIPLAEQSGLIDQVTQWVLRSALIQCSAWHAVGIRIPVAVNLSVRNLGDPELPGHVSRALAQAGLAAQWLELEITESMLMADPKGAMAVLTDLRRIGVRLAIDDFGIGYSSLAYLKRLPVSAIKIDQSFVTDMRQDKDDVAIIRSTIELAHNLGLNTIAEGVEDRATWNQLRALGCDEAQGYYLSRPLAPTQFTNWAHVRPDPTLSAALPVRGRRIRHRGNGMISARVNSSVAGAQARSPKVPAPKAPPLAGGDPAPPVKRVTVRRERR